MHYHLIYLQDHVLITAINRTEIRFRKCGQCRFWKNENYPLLPNMRILVRDVVCDSMYEGQ